MLTLEQIYKLRDRTVTNYFKLMLSYWFSRGHIRCSFHHGLYMFKESALSVAVYD